MISISKTRLKSKEKLSLFSDLATMLNAGIPILEAVESLENDSRGNLRKVLLSLKKSLSNGESLSHAMGRMPRAFDPVSINTIHAAEAGGTLEQTLSDLVVDTKREIEFSDQLRNTMIYPAFVMVVFLAIVVLMLTFVIPRIAKVFSTMKVHMPWVTRQMISLSNFFMDNWLIILVVFVAIIVGISLVVSFNKRLITRVLLSLPLLKRLGISIDLARFTRSFGLLLRSGVPIVEALTLSERVVQKKSIIQVIHMMKQDIEAGKPIALSMRKSRAVIPMIMARSVETAEITGTLEQTMKNLSDYFDEQVTSSLKILSSLIEPLLLIIVGILVGGLMVSIIAPIYNMISQINPSQK